MSYKIRLDELSLDNSGYSTVKIAEDGDRAIHWGNASHRGETRPIVTAEIGFLSITVNESALGPTGKKKLSALHNRHVFQIVDEKEEEQRLANTTPANRFDAAHAAIMVGDYELACNIEPSVLFDMIVLTCVKVLAENITVEHIAGIMREAEHESERVFRRGIDAAKAELREWLQT